MLRFPPQLPHIIRVPSVLRGSGRTSFIPWDEALRQARQRQNAGLVWKKVPVLSVRIGQEHMQSALQVPRYSAIQYSKYSSSQLWSIYGPI